MLRCWLGVGSSLVPSFVVGCYCGGWLLYINSVVGVLLCSLKSVLFWYLVFV